jgi:DNA-binding transcriptional LysR family regulator
MIMAISPALLEQCGQLSHPDQLAGFRLFARAAQAGVKTLRFLHPEHGRHVVEYTPHLMTGSVAVLQAGVIAGIGAACMPRHLCEDALRANRLVDAFKVQAGWQPEPTTMYAMLPARRGATVSTRLFLEFALPKLALAMRNELDSVTRVVA